MTLKYRHTLTSLNSAADRFVKDLREQTEKPELMPLPIWDESTEYPVLTDILKKWRVGEWTVVAGFQGHGKSVLASQSLFYVASTFKQHNDLVAQWQETGVKDPSLGDDPKPLGGLYFSLEMNWQQVFGRALAQFHGYDPANLSDPTKITEVEWRALEKTVQAARGWPIVVCDSPKMYVDELQEVFDQVSEEYKVRMVIADYLQLLSHHGAETDAVQKLDSIAKQLKEFALKNNVHLITPSSLSRDRSAYVPTAQQIRGSQAVAFHADNILLLHRPYVADPDLDPKWQKIAVINVEKARNAGTGQVRLRWNEKRLLFETMSPRVAEELGPLPTRSSFGGGY